MSKAIIILSAFILLAQGAVGADHPARNPGRELGRGPVNGWMMLHRDGPYSVSWITDAGLTVTTEQATRIRTLEEKYTRQFEPLQARLLETGKALKIEWLKLSPDQRRIAALQGELSRLHKQLLEKMSERRAEALEVLNAEQRERAEEAEQRRDMHHDRIRFQMIKDRR